MELAHTSNEVRWSKDIDAAGSDDPTGSVEWDRPQVPAPEVGQLADEEAVMQSIFRSYDVAEEVQAMQDIADQYP